MNVICPSWTWLHRGRVYIELQIYCIKTNPFWYCIQFYHYRTLSEEEWRQLPTCILSSSNCLWHHAFFNLLHQLYCGCLLLSLHDRSLKSICRKVVIATLVDQIIRRKFCITINIYLELLSCTDIRIISQFSFKDQVE